VSTPLSTRPLLVVLLALCSPSAGAAIDPGKLPPPAKGPADFERDIRPILDGTCLRCHGPERPKSHFRLDNRESALKGGDNGIDIIPGDSAKSPLIHYVARLVADLEMPPPGKGEPLSPAQVGLLRAWIDQGAAWGVTNPPVEFAGSASPVLRWIAVEGDKRKFREIEGVKESGAGGLERFSMREQLGPDRSLTVEGRALVPDHDFQLTLELRKTDLGFVRGGFEEWRRYYDDTGGYYRPFSPPAFDLQRDLHLDIGRAWIDFGLTLPRWPQLVLGYEYQFKEGAKSTLEWGAVANKNIFPASEQIDEHVHIAKLEVTHEFLGFRLENNARVELYDLKSRHDDAGSFTLGPAPNSTTRTSEGATHVQGMNTVHLERQLTDWWLVSGGYLYSKLDGAASLDQVTVNPFGAQASGKFWSTDGIALRRETHVISLANLLLPVPWLSASAGVQSEWTRQEGFGNVNLDQNDPNLPLSFALYPAMVQSDLDEQKVSENISLRLTPIPWTVLFAEARFDQDTIGQFEQDAPNVGTTADPTITFLRNTAFTNEREEGRVGFNTSPWSWAALSAHYKKFISDSDYDNSKFSLNPAGYSAFIRARGIDTDEFETKLALKPLAWLKTTLTYQLVATDYSTTTDPVPGATVPEGLRAGHYEARVYGLNATLTPLQRCYFSGVFTYRDSRFDTARNGSTSVVPYKGNEYSLVASVSYILNQSTDLHAAYSFSEADYGQDNVVNGLPLGLNYTRHGLMVGLTRHWTKLVTTNLRYGYYQYTEPGTGGINNYTAHGIMAMLSLKWP
jgi:hypothetical protein